LVVKVPLFSDPFTLKLEEIQNYWFKAGCSKGRFFPVLIGSFCFVVVIAISNFLLPSHLRFHFNNMSGPAPVIVGASGPHTATVSQLIVEW